MTSLNTKKTTFPARIEAANQEVNFELSNVMREAADITSVIATTLKKALVAVQSLETRVARLEGAVNFATAHKPSFQKKKEVSAEARSSDSANQSSQRHAKMVSQAMQNLYQQCRPPPRLEVFDALRLDGQSTMKLYSDPLHFETVWKREMSLQMNRRRSHLKSEGSKLPSVMPSSPVRSHRTPKSRTPVLNHSLATRSLFKDNIYGLYTRPPEDAATHPSLCPHNSSLLGGRSIRPAPAAQPGGPLVKDSDAAMGLKRTSLSSLLNTIAPPVSATRTKKNSLHDTTSSLTRQSDTVSDLHRHACQFTTPNSSPPVSFSSSSATKNTDSKPECLYEDLPVSVLLAKCVALELNLVDESDNDTETAADTEREGTSTNDWRRAPSLC